MLLAIFLAWYFWRRRKPKPGPPPLPPHEKALLGLRELEKDKDLPDREFYYRLSELLRAYMWGRFLIPALEMTTEELIPALDNRDISHALTLELRQDTARLLRRADPVKYAGREVGAATRAGDLETVRRVVQHSLPVEGTEENKDV